MYRGYVLGLTEGKHGFHTHTESDISESCTGAGGHFNLGEKKHASPTVDFSNRHRGA